MPEKLRKDSLSLGEFYRMSLQLYNSGKVDNKRERAKLDVTTAKVTAVHNFKYDKNERAWKTENKRSVKFEFLVKTRPVSYKKTDRIPTHVFPVTIVMYDIESGLDSSFRYRSGGLKKVLFPPKGCSAEKRLKIEEQNIKNGTDMHFFFFLEWSLRSKNLLFGPCRANRPPTTTNPKGYVYFEKHSEFVIRKLLSPLIGNPIAISKLKRMVFKNDDRFDAESK